MSKQQAPKRFAGLPATQGLQIFPGREPSEFLHVAWPDNNRGVAYLPADVA
jgi:hypothetical protein